jgi:hypothetical protein
MRNSAEEARRGGTIASDTRMEIIRPLHTMLHNSHKYISIFKTPLQSQGQPYNHKIVNRREEDPTGEHRRTYNTPEASEVAILIVGQNEKVRNRDVVLENHNSQSRREDEIMSVIIRVRIDPPHPLVCWKRRVNGAVLLMRPEKPRSRVTACVAR